MVRTKGPLLSDDAAGSLSRTLTYQRNNKRSSMRKFSTPKKTKTPKQNSIRKMVGFLSAQWKTLKTIDQATWAAPAKAAGHAPFHAYVRYNMRRWQNFRAPTQSYPADDAAVPPSMIKPTYYKKYHAFTIQIFPTGDATTWGYTIHSDPAFPYAPSLTNLIDIVPNVPGANEIIYEAPYPPGNYHILFRCFGFTGVWGNTPNDLFVVVDP